MARLSGRQLKHHAFGGEHGVARQVAAEDLFHQRVARPGHVVIDGEHAHAGFFRQRCEIGGVGVVVLDVVQDGGGSQCSGSHRALAARETRFVDIRCRQGANSPTTRSAPCGSTPRKRVRRLDRVAADHDRAAAIVEAVAIGRFDRAMIHGKGGNSEPVCLEDDAGRYDFRISSRRVPVAGSPRRGGPRDSRGRWPLHRAASPCFDRTSPTRPAALRGFPRVPRQGRRCLLRR